MKKVLLSATACVALFMASCSNESDLMNSSVTSSGLMTRAVANNEDFQIVNYDGEACVQFQNDSVFRAIYENLYDMSTEEIRVLFSGNGFVNQLQLMDEAMQEHEQIVDDFERDMTQPYPYQQIENFKAKYKDIFLFNPYDSTDFIPNYKVTSICKNFANKQGMFLIGDSVVYAPTRTEEDVYGSPIMIYGDNEQTDMNSLNKAESKYQIPDGEYVKVRAIPEILGFRYPAPFEIMDIGIELISQKKRSIFWRAHHADIYLTYNLKSTYQNSMWSKDKKKIHVYDKIGASDNLIAMVVITNFDTNTTYKLSGTMEIWSNEIPEAYKGVCKVSLP